MAKTAAARPATLTPPADPVRRWMVEQIINVLWFNEDMTTAEKRARAEAAIAAFDELCPPDNCDGIEMMLAAQMIAVHAASMELSRRAAAPGQTVEVRETLIGQAQQLASAFARHAAVLRRVRRERVLEGLFGRYGKEEGAGIPPPKPGKSSEAELGYHP